MSRPPLEDTEPEVVIQNPPMLMKILLRAVTVVALVGIGWVAGKAQTPEVGDFQIKIDAPAGFTTVECVRGCTLQGARNAGLPPDPNKRTYTYGCSGQGVERCAGAANGFVKK
jgi:hypothetical protein